MRKPANDACYSFFPSWRQAPEWVPDLVDVFARHQTQIHRESLLAREANESYSSNKILGMVRPSLVSMGFAVEGGSPETSSIRRPVFFGRNGKPGLQYRIDAYNDRLRLGLEVERARAWQGNAFYRDIIQMSLIADMDFAAVAVPNEYEYRSATNRAFDECEEVLRAVYSSQRLRLPFEGFLLIGY